MNTDLNNHTCHPKGIFGLQMEYGFSYNQMDSRGVSRKFVIRNGSKKGPLDPRLIFKGPRVTNKASNQKTWILTMVGEKIEVNMH